ncbi:MAG: cell division topological specificity factor MinE [Desulfotalea sp.]
MGLLNFFRNQSQPTSASRAKERLQVVIAHERTSNSIPDYLPRLQNELLAVIKKYIDVTEDKVDIKFDSEDGISTLEVNVELPERD